MALRSNHPATGLVTALVVFGLAGAIPPLGQRLVGAQPQRPAPETAVPADGIPAVPDTLRSIGGSEIGVIAGTDLIYAGSSAAAPVTVAPVPPSVIEPVTPRNPIIAPDPTRAWLARELPPAVPRQLYYGWAEVTVDERGIVTEARITQSTGDAAVDAATVARLKREALKPAQETLPDGSQVPIPYTGSIFIRWIVPDP